MGQFTAFRVTCEAIFKRAVPGVKSISNAGGTDAGMSNKKPLRILIYSLLLLALVSGTAFPANPKMKLTEAESTYIKNSGIIKAVSLAGVAPLQYLNSRGEIRGISWRVLEEISGITGLTFEYQLYNTVEEGLRSDGDIYFTANKNYAPQDMILSIPFFNTQTILFMNSKLDAKNLEGEIYAGVKGGALPAGVREENRVEYDTREDCLDAVESGEAGYGYGNAYSVAYYTLQNNYKNIITIPRGKDTREYRIGMMKEDEILLAILNKAIDAIDEQTMQNLILDATSRIERKINFSVVMETYGLELVSAAALMIGALLISVIKNIRAKNRLLISNRRHELLSRISNEYFYEYFLACDKLIISEKLEQKIDLANHGEEIKNTLKTWPQENDGNDNNNFLRLPLLNGDTGIYKAVSSVICGNTGKPHSIVGKLVDVTQEYEERKALLTKSQTDGLTGLYNSTTARELINERLKDKSQAEEDAFMLIDLDKLKTTNDTLGHLAGDSVLKSLASMLKNTFRTTDILGRLGGDEFCVYMKNIASLGSITEKAEQLNMLSLKASEDIPYTVCAGIALVRGARDIIELIERADKALYQAKSMGPGHIAVAESL